MNLIGKAFDFAAKFHWYQTRKNGEAYINHPLRVKERLTKLNFPFHDEIYATALLHDIYEESVVSISKLKMQFGSELCLRIYFISKDPKQYFNGISKLRLQNYFDKLRCGTLIFPDLILVKMADQIDNMKSLNVFSDEKQIQQINEMQQYFRLYTELFPHIPKKYHSVFHELLKELQGLVVKLENELSIIAHLKNHN